MVSVAAQIHAQNAAQPRRGVVVYSPGRRVGPQPAPTRRTTAPSRPKGAVNWAEVEQAFASTKGAQEKAQKTAQSEAEDAAWDKTPWYKKGLGMVLGNPIVSNALVPLGLIGVGGRAITAGIEEGMEAIGGPPDWLKPAAKVAPFSGVGMLASVDPERTEKDKRSFYEKVISPTSTYGFGELLDEDAPMWQRKLQGLGGDIGLDPTTYLGFGATRLVGAAGRSAALGKAAEATARVDDVLKLVDEAAQVGDFAKAAEMGNLASQWDAYARYLGETAEQIPMGKRVPLAQGRKARENFLGEIAQENPDLFARYGKQLTRGAERGFNTIRDPVLREALGLGDPAIRWMGKNIPKTEALQYLGARAGGAARAKANRLPLLGSAMEAFASKGTKEPSGILSRGKAGDPLAAASLIRIRSLMRRGAGSFEGRGNKSLTDLTRLWKQAGMGENEIRASFRAAELDAAPNEINKFFQGLTKIYERVAGMPMGPLGRDPNTYVPHMMTPQFRRYLRDHADTETVKAMGFVQEDLLEGSKYLEKARKLEPSAPGVATDFEIMPGKTITLTDGSIDEINEEMARVFDDFKGKAYMDDPVQIGEAYVSSVARQAGRDYALAAMAESGNPLVREISGPLAEAVAARNEWARSNPIIEMIKQGYVKGQRQMPVKARGEMPTSEFDELFGLTKHLDETQQQRNFLMKEGKQYVNEAAADIATTRGRLAETLTGIRTALMGGLQKKGRKAVSDIRGINTQLGKLSDDIKALGPLSTENIDEMVAIRHTLDQTKTATKAEIKKIRDRYGKKIPRDVKKVEKELVDTLGVLDDRLAEAQAQYAKSSAALRDEARKRKLALEEPLDAAEEQLQAAEAALGERPVSRQRVQEANAYIRSSFESEDAYEAERATWVQALQQLHADGVPLMRKTDGRLTPESMEVVRQRAATIEPEAVPPAAAATTAEEVVAPPAVAAPEPEPAAAPKIDRTIKRRGGNYYTDDGIEILKDGKEWRVVMDGVEDFGTYSKLKDAKEVVQSLQEAYAIEAGEEIATETVEEAAEAAVREVPEEVTALAAKISSTKPPEPKVPAKRITRRWKTVDPDTGISIGPEGWEVQPFEASTRMHPDPTTGELAPAEAPRGKRWVAINADPQNDLLRARSWGTEREAKLAVEDALRRQRRSTPEEYYARTLMREGGVHSRFENLGSQLPPRPTTLTPEEAAANRAAAAAVPQKGPLFETGRAYQPGAPWELTPEGEQIMATMPTRAGITGTPAVPGAAQRGEQIIDIRTGKPATDQTPRQHRVKVAGQYAETPTTGRAADPYWQAYADWQNELQLSMTAETPGERAAAKRRAQTKAGEFNQPTGKYHSRWSAENVLMEDAAWEAKKLQSEDWLKAKANYDKVERDIEAQTEAMVYVKAHDPILGQDIYTRTSSTAVGHGPGEERVPVLPKPPTQGEVVTGTREVGYQEPRQPTYAPETRARDRALLDDPEIMNYMTPPNRAKYQDLMDDGERIAHRIEVADANQARLDELDTAAKAAYTAEVKAADDAVADAKRKLERLRSEESGENPTPGIGVRVNEQKRAVQAAIDNQTTVRQQWMAADQAWRDALSIREDYLKIANQVSLTERTLISDSSQVGKRIIEVVEETGEVPDYVTMPHGGRNDLSPQQRKWARELIIARNELQAAQDMGMEFMTDIERRALVGRAVDIDATKREMRHVIMQDVQRAKDVLPRRSSAEELAALNRPEGFEIARFGETPPPAHKVPPVLGHEGLAGRAYAESFEPMQPGTRNVWQLTEEGTPVEVPKISGQVPYEPRTERAAIGELQEQAAAIERREAGTPAAEKLELETTNIERERVAAVERADRRKAEESMASTIERDDALSPLGDRLETLGLVDDALNDKKKLIPLRDAAEAQRKVIVSTKPKAKSPAELLKTIDDTLAVAKANPDLLDDDLAVTEAKLQAARSDAEVLAANDLSAKQVQRQIDLVGRKDDNSLDIMLTTVGKDWRMTYEANGGKKAVLKEGDIIVQRELDRMFHNVYDISKDKVLFGRTLNAFTNLFKTYATLTPGFHVRNALSAIFMNSADGVPLLTQLGAAGIWKEYMNATDSEQWLLDLPGRTLRLPGGRTVDGQMVADAFAATYGSGAGGRFTEAGFAEAVGGGGWVDYLEKAQRNRFTRLSQRAGQRVEGSVRLAMGLDSVLRGDSVESAIDRISRIHFDYSDVSKLDENAKRLIPFWTFMSRNLPMQVSQMWTHPQTYMKYQAFTRNMAATNEEYTPEYWLKAGAFNSGLKVPEGLPAGGAQGLPIYLSPDLGFTRLKADLKDYEDFLSGKRPGAVLSQVNPLLSAPIEFVTRQDIFTGQRFEEGETVPAGGILGLPIKLSAMLTGQYEGGEVDAAFANTVRALNPLQDRSSRLLPQLSGGDEEGRKRQLESWLRTMLGAPVRTLTPKQQDNEYFRRYYEQLDALNMQRDRLQRQAG